MWLVALTVFNCTAAFSSCKIICKTRDGEKRPTLRENRVARTGAVDQHMRGPTGICRTREAGSSRGELKVLQRTDSAGRPRSTASPFSPPAASSTSILGIVKNMVHVVTSRAALTLPLFALLSRYAPERCLLPNRARLRLLCIGMCPCNRRLTDGGAELQEGGVGSTCWTQAAIGG